MSSLAWPHKDLLDVSQLSTEQAIYLLDMADQFHEIASRPIKKVPTLRGKSIVLLFAEDSTRTRVSFDVAGKRLSADTFSLSQAGSSMNKGETLKDTALTLQAMSPDIIVVRHSSSGAAQFLGERLACSIVNAGDGWHAHPTQALLDAYTLRRHWQGSMEGKHIAIVGDIAHSRVARSNIDLLNKLGAKVRLFAPATLLPARVDTWPVTVCTSLQEAVQDVDAIMCLRLQLERQQAGLLPDLREYASRFCITSALLQKAAPSAVILHPGPINRGMELASEIADAPQSRILDQVAAGVSIRMAVLFTLGTRNQDNTI